MNRSQINIENAMETIEKLSAGADFVRADLHIRSYGEQGGSFDIDDAGMTPENIVDTALEKNLSIISIADHKSQMKRMNRLFVTLSFNHLSQRRLK